MITVNNKKTQFWYICCFNNVVFFPNLSVLRSRGSRNREMKNHPSRTTTNSSGNSIFQNLFKSMPHPEFCTLVTELLIQHHKTHRDTAIVAHCLLKLTTTAKLNPPNNATTLYNHGMPKLILDGFRHVLATKGAVFEPERRLLLDLFLVISQQSFLSRELHQYLQLFKENDAPVELLLDTLVQLANGFQWQPSCYLGFPILQSTEARELRFPLSSSSVSDDTLSVSMQVMNHSVSMETSDVTMSARFVFKLIWKLDLI